MNILNKLIEMAKKILSCLRELFALKNGLSKRTLVCKTGGGTFAAICLHKNAKPYYNILQN
jgi:hypothetical protein